MENCQRLFRPVGCRKHLQSRLISTGQVFIVNAPGLQVAFRDDIGWKIPGPDAYPAQFNALLSNPGDKIAVIVEEIAEFRAGEQTAGDLEHRSQNHSAFQPSDRLQSALR